MARAKAKAKTLNGCGCLISQMYGMILPKAIAMLIARSMIMALEAQLDTSRGGSGMSFTRLEVTKLMAGSTLAQMLPQMHQTLGAMMHQTLGAMLHQTLGAMRHQTLGAMMHQTLGAMMHQPPLLMSQMLAQPLLNQTLGAMRTLLLGRREVFGGGKQIIAG